MKNNGWNFFWSIVSAFLLFLPMFVNSFSFSSIVLSAFGIVVTILCLLFDITEKVDDVTEKVKNIKERV